jgi:hypothetical protein
MIKDYVLNSKVQFSSYILRILKAPFTHALRFPTRYVKNFEVYTGCTKIIESVKPPKR